jgi:hypothetical protein
MMAYTSYAQIATSEEVYGRYREPTVEELEIIKAYREKYRQAFGVLPLGTHWLDEIGALVNLLR